jgi:hypothetical protein
MLLEPDEIISLLSADADSGWWEGVTTVAGILRTGMYPPLRPLISPIRELLCASSIVFQQLLVFSFSCSWQHASQLSLASSALVCTLHSAA